jgi:hypothetical protein
MFQLEFCTATSCSEIVNHRHIYPPIDLAELETMKSIVPQDGENQLTINSTTFANPNHSKR